MTHLIREGHTAVIPGDQPHGGEWLQEAELLMLYLAPSFIERASGDLAAGEMSGIVEGHMIRT